MLFDVKIRPFVSATFHRSAFAPRESVYLCDCPDRLLLKKLLLHLNDVGFLKTCYMPTFGCLVKKSVIEDVLRLPF